VYRSYNEVKQFMLDQSNVEVLGPGKHMSAAACAGTCLRDSSFVLFTVFVV
jgi:hypothetical protein